MNLHSMICVVLAVFMLFSSCAAAETIGSVTVDSAQLSSSKPTLDGMVRVYLSSLGSPTSVTLTVSGKYSLSDGTSLSTGETLRVSMNSSNGRISVLRGGTTYNMGSTFTVRRHSTTGTNGIKISQARKPGNLYPGDIQFKAVALNGGGYKLYTIAHIYIEDYLYGVVPYEMGSSAPIEALKAQAVAARTYTVRMMNARSSWSYDVVDTTGDQTYNGTPTTTTNCNTAVNATKGIVLMNGSSYTATYYSASNGGQTESIKNAWGTSGYSYLGVKDDPFDYANPYSTVRKTTLYADADNSGNSASLLSLLKAKAVSALSKSGYKANTYNTTIQTIKGVTAHTAKYASPSRLYTKMDFTLYVSTYNSSNVYVSVTTTVTCDIFGELEGLLGMGIQSTNNELWSVTESGSAFLIQARRYGHGIGMSQRGAMYMGQLGYTYDEILGFYYPGSSRVGCTFTNTILAADSSEEITTEEDPAETGDDSIRGVVTLSGDAELAVRSAKSTSASVLTVLANGASVTVLSNDGTWCKVTFGSITGYVPTSALILSETAPDSDDTDVSSIYGFAVVTANGYLNLRESGSYSAAIVSTAPGGAILTVLSWGSEWSHIQYGTIVAYAASDYLQFSTDYPDEIDETAPDDTEDGGDDPDTDDTDILTATVVTESGSLNMRLLPQAGSTILTTIPKGATVNVTSKGATWSGVTYLGTNGYVMTMFLSFSDDAGDSGDTDTDDTSAMLAMVVTQSGSLNFRELPQTGSTIYCTIPRFAVIQVLSVGSEWCQVTYSGINGYVMTAFLTFVDSDDSDNDDTGDDSGDTGGDSTTAVVTTKSGSLNLRAEAVSGSEVLTRIPKGETIVVLQRLSSWTYTCYQDCYGYVMNAFLTFSEENETETGDPVSATVTTTSGSLNLRDEPYGDILTRIPQYATVDVFTRGTAWSYLNYNDTFGYAMTVYLTFATEEPTEENAEDNTSDNDDDVSDSGDTSGNPDAASATSAIVNVESGSLNLRVSKSETADVLTTIPNETEVSILLYTDDWCKVVYGGYQGYVQTQYLAFDPSDDAENANETDDTQEDDTEEDDTVDNAEETDNTSGNTYSVTAWVNTASGSLNLRESASTDAAVLTQIPQYAQVEALSGIEETWCKTRYGDYTGYVMSVYLTTVDPADEEDAEDPEDTDDTDDTADTTDTTDPTDTTDTEDAPIMDSTLHEPSGELIVYVRPPAGSAALALYDQCSESGDILQIMDENSQVEIIRVGDTWCEVIFSDQMGYCLRDGLSFFDE